MPKCKECGGEPLVRSVEGTVLCKEHAKERLQNVKSKLEESTQNYNRIKSEFEDLKEEHGVETHQEMLDKMKDDDTSITEEEMSQYNDLEDELITARQNKEDYELRVDTLEDKLEKIA